MEGDGNRKVETIKIYTTKNTVAGWMIGIGGVFPLIAGWILYRNGAH